ncbi:uncharacterized protein LOC130547926 [Triplophysa rosa]|nr:uncharacterized protein LOC130547926 [Triplophysa rosa]
MKKKIQLPRELTLVCRPQWIKSTKRRSLRLRRWSNTSERRQNIGIWCITPCSHALESRGETRSGVSPLLWVPIYGRLGHHPVCYGQHVLVSYLALNTEPLDSVSALIPPEPLGPAHFMTILLAYSSFVCFRYEGKMHKQAKSNLALNPEPLDSMSVLIPCEPLGPAHFVTVLLAYSSFVCFRYEGKMQKHAKFNLVMNPEPPGPLSAHLPLSHWVLLVFIFRFTF